MKLEINTNIYFTIWWFIIGISLIIIVIIAFNHVQDYYNYQKYISDNQKQSMDWYYSCDSVFSSALYNCPINLQLKNLTGYYCNQTMICQNSYKIK